MDLHGGVLVEVLQQPFGIGGLGQLDDDAHALAVGFVAQVGDALQALLAHQLGDALDQGGFVGHVGQLGDDDAAAAALHLLQVGARLHGHLARARCRRRLPGYSRSASSCKITPPVGKSGPWMNAHQIFNADIVQLLPVYPA